MAREKTQRIKMVTGKGGVGKSTVAAMMAMAHAKAGERTLLVELGERSQFTYLYQKPIDFEPTEVQENLWVSLWNGEECLKEYLYHLVRIQKVVDLFFENRIMKAFVKAAPALRELAVTGKITSGIRNWGPELPYDVIVVDGYATGHFLALVQASKGMAQLIERGPMGEQSRAIQKVLKDPSCTDYYVVAIPEDLPVTEALELAGKIEQQLEQKPKMLMNKWFFNRETSSEYRKYKSEFAQYIADLIDRQEKSAGQISQARKLPLCFSPDPRDVVSELILSWGSQ